MDPSLKLLITCCRYCYGAESRASVAQTFGGADLERLLTLSRRHRVQGLAWKAVNDSGVPLPLEVGAAFRKDAQRIAQNGLQAAAVSARLHHAFGSARVPMLFLKGLVLGRLAWGDPFLKSSIDIDLLVPEAAISSAAALLAGLDFEQTLPEPSVDPVDWHRRRKESGWTGHGVTLDLHSRVADNRRLLPTLTARTRADLVEVAPGISLPTFPLAEQVAYLAVHGASSAWFRLKWLAEFAALLHPIPPAGIANLRIQAIQLGAGRAIDQALVLAHKLFATPVPDELEFDAPTRRLVRIARAQLEAEREPTARPLGTATIHFSQLLLRPGSRFAFGELGRQVGDILTR